MNIRRMEKRTGDNRGLSLIELLVAIVVLGVVCIPLIVTFINSAKINRNAKRVHSATVLAQSIMEEYKSTDIRPRSTSVSADEVSPDIFSDIDASGLSAEEKEKLKKQVQEHPEAFVPLVEERMGLIADNGHKYDVRITLDPWPYSGDSNHDGKFDLSSMTVTDASNVNIQEIPDLPEVDTAKCAVIAGQIMAHDNKVVDAQNTYEAEKKMMEWFWARGTKTELENAGILKANDEETLESVKGKLTKEIIVTLDDNSAYAPAGSVLVTCDVIYHYEDSTGKYDRSGMAAKYPDPQVLTSVYQSFYKVETTPAADDPSDLTLDGRLTAYIFWTPSPYNIGNDEIKIINKTPYRMNTYLIRQDDGKGLGTMPVVSVGNDETTGEVFDPVTKHKNGRMQENNVNLITNLTTDSRLHDLESGLHVYEITVDVYEGNGEDITNGARPVTSMTSTKEVYQ